MPQQRWAWTHKYAVPMFVASLASVVIAGLGLLAVLNLDWDGTDRDDPDTPIDECLVGQWRMLEHAEALEVEGTTVELTLDGEGAVYEFSGDGTGSADYGDGTRFVSNALGQDLPATVAGTLNFRYATVDGVFQVVEMLGTAATMTMEVLGTPVDVPYALSTTSPANYVCEGDTASFSAEDGGYAAQYERL